MVFLVDFVRSIITSYYLAVSHMVACVFGTLMAYINYVGSLVVDGFDTFLYYAMNLVMMGFLFVDLLDGWYGDVSEKVGILVTGYNNDFFSKIN